MPDLVVRGSRWSSRQPSLSQRCRRRVRCERTVRKALGTVSTVLASARIPEAVWDCQRVPVFTPRQHLPRGFRGALLGVSALAILGASGPHATAATCEAESARVAGVDRLEFEWELTSIGQHRVRAYHDFNRVGTALYSTVSESLVRSPGEVETFGNIPASHYSTGTYNWRIWLWSGPGSPWYYPPGPYWTSCGGPQISLDRPPAPTVGLTGSGTTDDGWRRPTSGQQVRVSPPDGAATRAEYVRFQYDDGGWGPHVRSPAAIPTTGVRRAEAYSESEGRLTGSRSSMVIRTDSTPPSAPSVSAAQVEEGSSRPLSITGGSDAGSGFGAYEARFISPSGRASTWSALATAAVPVGHGRGGSVLEVRACDRVGNCSQAARVEIAHAPQPNPAQHAAPSGASKRPPERTQRFPPSDVTPVITAVVPVRPHSGSGRVYVSMNRAALLDVTLGDARRPAWRVWVGKGKTLLRLPARSRSPRRATVSIRPTAGSVSGSPVSTSVRFPRAPAARSTSRSRLSRFHSGSRFFLYDVDAAVREIIHPSDGSTGLSRRRGAFRQEPSRGGLFSANDRGGRLGKVNERNLHGLSAEAIAATLRSAIERSPAHAIGIDELTPMASDPRGPRIRNGRIPPPDPNSFASRFAQAMELLDVPSPFGETWAGRIHVYIAPAVGSAIAAGRGPDRNLGRDGIARFRTYRTAMSGLARAGGVWIEMYHGHTRRVTPFTAEEWKRTPRAFVNELRRAGGDTSRLHFLLPGTSGYPKGKLPAGCVTPMRCVWELAESTSAGRLILRNGVGGYRLGDQARPWLAEWQRRAGKQ